MHFLSQDNENEVQLDFSGHVMPFILLLASHDANGIKITLLHSSGRQLK